MSSTSGTPSPVAPSDGLRWPKRVGAAVAILFVALFLWLVSRFYDHQTGLTYFLKIGDKTETVALNQFREVPHYTYRNSYGYDGAYYVQLALSPLLNDPQLPTAIDSLPYRARRILLSWVAWALGAGDPTSIVHVFPFLNIAAWLAIAWLLLRWFPLDNPNAMLRWAAILASHGMCTSVSHSLVDAPSLLLIIIALRCLEQHRPLRGAVALSLAALTRETSLLAATIFAGEDLRRRDHLLKLALIGIIIVAPAVAWLLYVRLKFGGTSAVGLNNFAVPVSGLFEKWTEALAALSADRVWWRDWATAACTLALTVQCAFFLFRWRVRQPWWRLGVSFAALALFLSTPVWEGSPGAATRVLLPMGLAFNVLVPSGRRWLPVLLAGNLTVLASVNEFTPPAQFISLSGERSLVRAISVTADEAWYGAEQRGANRWCWASGDASIRLRNVSNQPLRVKIEGSATALDADRVIEIFASDQKLWSATLASGPTRFSVEFLLPPGSLALGFQTDRPAPPPDGDGRRLAFSISNLKLSVASVPTPADTP